MAIEYLGGGSNVKDGGKHWSVREKMERLRKFSFPSVEMFNPLGCVRKKLSCL